MIATAFDEENCVLNPPADLTAAQCDPLSVFVGNNIEGFPVCISCWKVTKEELEEIKKTGRIWVIVLGQGMSPIAPTGISPFKV